MSWLSKHTGIHLGNIGAPIGAIVGSVIPGVGTALGSGLGQTIGALGSHKNLKTAVGQGVLAGGLAYGAGALAGKLGSAGAKAGSIGPDGVPIVTRGGLASSVGDVMGTTGASSIGSEVPASLASTATKSIGSRLASDAGNVLDFAEAHPNATSGALNAVGAIPGQNAEARLRNVQASTLEQQANESAYDFANRKRRDELMSPIWSALGTSADGYSKVAPNPYSVG